MGIDIGELIDLSSSILDFAELADCASERLCTLSSGQRLRLGFAISTAVQYDIMLLDEWIGAGDAAFLKKARARMLDRVQNSKIMVMASHSRDLVKSVCNRGLVLQDGRVVHDAQIEDAYRYYDAILNSGAAPVTPTSAPRQLIDRGSARRFRTRVLESMDLPFPHHVLFENTSGQQSNIPTEHSALIEYIDTDPDRAMTELTVIAKALSLGGPDFLSINPLRIQFSDERGRKLTVEDRGRVTDGNRRAQGGVGRLHLTVSTTADCVEQEAF